MGFGIAHAYSHVTSRAFGWSTLFAVASFCVSCAAVYISVKAFIDAKRPVLVFERMAGAGWMVKNVGNGPALNVVFVEGDFDGKWLNPIKLPSLSKDGLLRLEKLTVAARLGVTYTDFDDRLYSSDCTNYITKIRQGKPPDDWPAFDASKLPYYEWP
jgi:hypothetical protein